MIESFNKKELEEKIDQYINGQLTAQEVDELWAELIQDDYHLDYLKSAANLKAVIERKREEKRAKQKRKYWYYAAAAVIALLVVVLGVMNISFQSGVSVEPVDKVELEYYRSGDGAIDSGGESEVIRNAIKLANTGQVDEAISLLSSELETASDPEWIAELNLNLGSLYYNEAEYDEAISHFRNVVQQEEHVDVLMVEKAYWYIGNAYFHMDKLTEAQANIERAYELNGAYRRVAKGYLDALSE